MNVLQVEPGPARWRKFRGGKTYKEKAKPIGTTADPPAGMAVDCISSWNLFCFDISFSCHPCLMLPLSLDPACSWHFLNLDSPSCWQLWSPRLDTLLSWQCSSDVVAVSWDRCLFSRFPLTSLSLGILIFWHLFSWDLLLLTHGFRLAPFFLFPVAFTLFFWALFLLKLLCFETFCLDICFVLRWFFVLMSFSWHLFLLAFSYIANKVHPVQNKTCMKSFLY